MSAIATFTAVNLDCPDPAALAEFYHRLTGWEITYSDENYGAVSGDVTLYFQRADDHHRPTWPEPHTPQQIHLDFRVDDLDKAEALLLELGAAKPEFQPGQDRWRVLTDPAGHPFCICRKS
jgi:catechol 2,3-dioxygenase-like lactoylglutathione lyase family enzyme